ncbi:hypothetical protein C8J57DRAFT_1578801 [Mycena rebaudengoi]|nr:hypothetical protein C8J57DRAFT_1578801 [Mycena rebaudengoi]
MHGRYASWTMQLLSEEHKNQYFVPTVEAPRMVLDNNKHMQEAGCNTFANLEEDTGLELVPYLEPVLQNLVVAFNKYQHKNMLILYNVAEILMPPLTNRWACLKDDEEDLIPLLDDRVEIENYATCELRALAVVYEAEGDDFKVEGNGFELIGLMAIFDLPREDMKQTIDDALALGVKAKMVTSDHEGDGPSSRFGSIGSLLDHMYPVRVLKDGPAPGSKHASLDEMIMDADRFADVFPEHKYEIVKWLQGLGHLCAMTGPLSITLRATVIAIEGRAASSLRSSAAASSACTFPPPAYAFSSALARPFCDVREGVELEEEELLPVPVLMLNRCVGGGWEAPVASASSASSPLARTGSRAGGGGHGVELAGEKLEREMEQE